MSFRVFVAVISRDAGQTIHAGCSNLCVRSVEFGKAVIAPLTKTASDASGTWSFKMPF